jgi:sialidase-1
MNSQNNDLMITLYKFPKRGRQILPLLFSILLLLTACVAKDKQDKNVPRTYPVFIEGEEPVLGYKDERYAQFREQNILVTNSGKVVVIVQGRNATRWSDRSGQDLVCKISDDHGVSWSDPIMMATDGEKSICPNAAVYDREKGRIICLYSVFQWPFTDAESRKTWEGLKNREYSIHSDDEGLTWSEPREITHTAKADSVVQVYGSGEGIQLKSGPDKGRLIVPGGDFVEPHKRVFAWFSDDHGETWKSSKVVPNPHERLTPCENAIAELSDGSLLMNERNSGIGQRWQSRSHDGGLTWDTFEMAPDLPSISCNASIITVDYKKQELLLYAGPVGPNPNVKNVLEEYQGKRLSSQDKRQNGVVFASMDGGKTWKHRKLIVPDLFAYSSLMQLADGKIGLFYEARDHKDIMLVKFTVDWLFEENITN